MPEDNLIVQCARCGAKNRVPKARLSDRPVCGKCRSPLNPGGHTSRPVAVTDTSFPDEVLDHPGPVLVDCWAPWCGPCKMIAPILDELAGQYAGKVKIAKLNVDENPETAARYQIQSIPTMLLFKGGRPVDRLVGALPKAEVDRHIRSVL